MTIAKSLGTDHILKTLKRRRVKEIIQEIKKNSQASRTTTNARKGKQNQVYEVFES
jgi:hypothetical protein